MIIVGYPGVGKSTLVEKYFGGKYIDLESSNFNALKNNENDLIINIGPRYDQIPKWAKLYVRIALDLSRKGHEVFISSHEMVQRALLEEINERDHVVVVYPSLSLKSDWLRKLRERYQYYNAWCSDEEMDVKKRALMRAIDHFDDDIEKLHNSSFNEVVIESMDYDLEQLIFGKEDEA